MSAAVYGAMLHARIHRIPGKRQRLLWWSGLTFMWACIFFAPTIMILARVDYSWVVSVVRNQVLVALYGVATGCLLRLHTYFHMMKQENADRTEVAVGILVFAGALGQSMATSIWL